MNTFIGFAYVLLTLAFGAVVGWFASANVALTAPLTILFGLMSFGLGMAVLQITKDSKAAKEKALREKAQQDLIESQRFIPNPKFKSSPYEDPTAFRP